jgi:hypothetical protein
LSASLSTQHPSGPVSWLPVASWPADSSMLAVWEDRIRQTQKLDRPRQDTRSCQMG